MFYDVNDNKVKFCIIPISLHLLFLDFVWTALMK